MGFIRIRKTEQLMTEDEFRRTFTSNVIPNPIPEEWLNEFGADIVFDGPQATPSNPYEYSFMSGVELIKGKYYTKHSIGPVFKDIVGGKTAAEQMAEYVARKNEEQWKNIRSSRDQKLKETDWIVIRSLERSEAVPAEWLEYRQALRDITNTPVPFDVIWPEIPA